VIRVDGLTKSYGEQVALDSVDMTVPAGAVYGLVGPNGAGKTTLLSILAGLRRPAAGRVEIDAAAEHRAVLPDAPRFDKWLTAREVVGLAAGLGGVPGSDRIDSMLEEAGLAESADRAVAGFSRGMLQRLGIAATLVTDPQLVMLDEPAAALDPAGRREVLDVVERMRGSSTVLFSSHILSDVQAVCDWVGILDGGRLLYEGPVPDLLGGASRMAYLVRVRHGPEIVAATLQEHDWVLGVEFPAEHLLRVAVATLDAAEQNLVPALTAAGVPVISVEPERVSLEQVFLELTR
jgi:ABC-2 type transport system ATP-binding protein